MGHSYSWTVNSGFWSAAANWDDQTLHFNPALNPPGAGDTAIIVNPNGANFDVIGGSGSAALLSASGFIALTGSFNFATLAHDSGQLDILSATTVTSSALTANGLQVSGPGAVMSAAELIVGSASSIGLPLAVSNHGAIEVASLDLLQAIVFVSPTSTLEVGTTGGAAPGTLTIDAGATVSGTGTISTPVVDNGLLAVGSIAASSQISSAISGTGDINLEHFARLTLLGSVGSGLTLHLGALDTLTLGDVTGFSGTIEGFQPGDLIDSGLPGVIDASYVGDTTGGTLTLNGTAGALATIDLTGDYTGLTFLTRPLGQGVQVTLPDNIVAPGTAATLDITQNSQLAGVSNYDTVSLGPIFPDTTLHGSPITQMLPGATLVAGEVTGDGTLVVGGTATSLSVSDFIHLGDEADQGFGLVLAPASLALVDHATAQADLILLECSTDTLTVDSTASFEVGEAGGASVGALTVDAGKMVRGWGTIDAIVDNAGTVAATGVFFFGSNTVDAPGTLVITGAIGGSGLLQITSQGSLTPLGSVCAGQTIAFSGQNGVLDISAGNSVAADITGLAPGDEILVPADVIGATFTPGKSGVGTLALTNIDGGTIETLAMTNPSSATSYVAVPLGAGIPTAIVLAAGGSATAGIPSGGLASPTNVYWQGALDSLWNNAGNWNLTPPPASSANPWPPNPPTVAPGAADTVFIDNPSNDISPQTAGFQYISGSGNAAAAEVSAEVVWSGNFNFGTLELLTETLPNSPPNTTATPWKIASGSTVTAAKGAALQGDLTVTDAQLTVPGTLFMGRFLAPSPTHLSVLDGSSAQIGAFSVFDPDLGPQFLDTGQTIVVDTTSKLEFGSAGGAKTGFLTVDPNIDVVGSSFSLPPGTIIVRSAIDAAVTNNGTLEQFAINGAVTNNGTLKTSVITGDVINNGTLIGNIVNGDVSGSGVILASATSANILNGSIGSGQTIIVSGSGSTLSLGTSPVAAQIQGFGTGDILVLANQQIDAADFAATGANTGTLTLSRDGTPVETLSLMGNYANDTFVATADLLSDRSYVVVAALPCFAAGTRIRTPSGDVRVEALRTGDIVLTASGERRPITWIGHRSVECRQHPHPERIWPVCIMPGAFAQGVPARELRLSPDHAVFANGVLIPVRHLINGSTIAQVRVRQVTYYHVELDRHVVLLAEQLPVESYLDDGRRSAFTNGGAAVQLHPEFGPAADHALRWEMLGCAPLRIIGPDVDVVVRSLKRRAHELGGTRSAKRRIGPRAQTG